MEGVGRVEDVAVAEEPDGGLHGGRLLGGVGQSGRLGGDKRVVLVQDPRHIAHVRHRGGIPCAQGVANAGPRVGEQVEAVQAEGWTTVGRLAEDDARKALIFRGEAGHGVARRVAVEDGVERVRGVRDETADAPARAGPAHGHLRVGAALTVQAVLGGAGNGRAPAGATCSASMASTTSSATATRRSRKGIGRRLHQIGLPCTRSFLSEVGSIPAFLSPRRELPMHIPLGDRRCPDNPGLPARQAAVAEGEGAGAEHRSGARTNGCGFWGGGCCCRQNGPREVDARGHAKRVGTKWIG